MPRDQLEGSYFSPDVLEFIGMLHAHAVRYVVVGGEAVIYYGHARLTGDIDFFYDGSEENTAALFQALTVFWGGRIPGIQGVEELREEGIIIQFGVPPNRIDLLNRIDGVTFADAWESHAVVTIRTTTGEVPLFYLGLADLIRNKAACAPPRTAETLSSCAKYNPEPPRVRGTVQPARQCGGSRRSSPPSSHLGARRQNRHSLWGAESLAKAALQKPSQTEL